MIWCSIRRMRFTGEFRLNKVQFDDVSDLESPPETLEDEAGWVQHTCCRTHDEQQEGRPARSRGRALTVKSSASSFSLVIFIQKKTTVSGHNFNNFFNRCNFNFCIKFKKVKTNLQKHIVEMRTI